ncbi:MAG: hypothetical protein HGA36_04090 [Candidatus Moranbacteria bacterium]|nr:hypothetical protein [Candidatus Moranbacteria bacterium]
MQQDKKAAELEEIKALEEEKVIEQIEELEKEKEIEVEEVEFETQEILEKKKRREAIFEMALFFVLGVLLGITMKTEAVKRITIGFNDYLIAKPTQSYDITAIKKGLDAQMAEQQAAQQAAQTQPQTQKAN